MLTSRATDPAHNTCYFCCEWFSHRKGELFVCQTCVDEKRMANYNFLLCESCLKTHQKNHLKPRAQIYTREMIDDFIIRSGNFADF